MRSLDRDNTVPAMYIDLIIYLFGACAVRARNYEIIQNRSVREIL